MLMHQPLASLSSHTRSNILRMTNIAMAFGVIFTAGFLLGFLAARAWRDRRRLSRVLKRSRTTTSTVSRTYRLT